MLGYIGYRIAPEGLSLPYGTNPILLSIKEGDFCARKTLSGKPPKYLPVGSDNCVAAVKY